MNEELKILILASVLIIGVGASSVLATKEAIKDDCLIDGKFTVGSLEFKCEMVSKEPE